MGPDRTADSTVVITSTPRSGSIWFSRVLIDHPDLRVHSHAEDQMWPLYLLYPLRMVSPYHDDAVSERSAVDRILWPARTAFVRGRFRAAPGAGVRLLSSPTNAAFLPLFREVFPDARFVFLQRNPLDVIASFKDYMENNATAHFMRRFRRNRGLGLPRAVLSGLAHYFHRYRWLRSGQGGYIHFRSPGFYGGRELDGLEYLCWYYCGLERWIEGMLEGLPPDQFRRVSYDAFMEDPRGELESFLTFIGARVEEAHLEHAVEGIRRPSRRKRDDLTAGEVAEIEACVGRFSGRGMRESS